MSNLVAWFCLSLKTLSWVHIAMYMAVGRSDSLLLSVVASWVPSIAFLVSFFVSIPVMGLTVLLEIRLEGRRRNK